MTSAAPREAGERWAFVSEITEWHEFAEQALLAAEAEPNNLGLRDWFCEQAQAFPDRDGPSEVREIWARAQHKAKVVRLEPSVRFRPLNAGPKIAEEDAEPKAKLSEIVKRAAAKPQEEEPEPDKREPQAKPVRRYSADVFRPAPLPPPEATGLERLTYPRGLLGHVVQYIYDTDRLPDRIMALAGALLTCSKALDRRVITPSETGLVLFLLIVAESGAGKQHILNCLRILLRAMGAEDAIVGMGIASQQSIDEILEGVGERKPGRPSALVTIDEYGSFLTRIASKGQTGNVSEIPAKLQTLWGWSPEMEYIGDIKVGKDTRNVVYGPAFSVFGVSTERAFFSALKQKNVSGGFVNRHFLLDAGRGAPKPVKPKYKWLECPDWLVGALREIAGEPAANDNRTLWLEDARGNKVLLKDHFRRMGWGPGAEGLIYDFECENRAMPSVEDREIWIRAHDIATRFATVVAVFRGSEVVDVDDVKWAIELTRYSTRFLMKGMRKHMLEEFEQADLVEHIREQFRQAPINDEEDRVLTHGAIRKYCERKCKDHRQIDAAIYHLVLCEEIVELADPGGAGRPTRRWKWN